MDPASAIGVASASLTIVNLIAKNVTSLSDLQSKYKAADIKVTLLIGQLSVIKAALNQMAKLLEGDHEALRDPELVSDFSTSLGCVEAVVVVLDDRISTVRRNSANSLTIRSKINFIWDEKTMDDYLGLLNNQVQALGLLTTALQCRTALDQSNLLRSRDSRHILGRVKDDTSSLLWLRDSESVNTYRSAGTQDLATVNATFAFDPEIFNSKVYQMATRSNMIETLTRTVRSKLITHVTGEPNSSNKVFPKDQYQYQYPGRNPAAWARTAGAAAYHGAYATPHDGEDQTPLRYGSPEIDDFTRGFNDALSRIGEEDEDLESHVNGSGMPGTSNTGGGSGNPGESRPLWLQSRRMSRNSMWT